MKITCGDCILCARILQAVTDPSLLPSSFVWLTKSQNNLIVLTSSNLLDGLVALNRSVSSVFDGLCPPFDLDGEFEGDVSAAGDTKIYWVGYIIEISNLNDSNSKKLST